ncbi:hypothetical protein TIFTF001_029526 [Ficus carica]|uniref:Uncharacterized protein n=1 Tax=Ficus carica TaxID=3494 RepID=A0AA88DRU8_FICCA|nr:hypothetical protein TIFTF001_029526 [Ficus carica]
MLRPRERLAKLARPVTRGPRAWRARLPPGSPSNLVSVVVADHYASIVYSSIMCDVEIMVSGPNNLPSRLPSDYITLSTEFFRVGLRLPCYPYLRRALQRLNVAPMQLNANAYRILISCFVLWTKNYA